MTILIVLIILCSLILVALVIAAVFSILLYNRLGKIQLISGSHQSSEYAKSVATQKHKKPALKPVKQVVRGRSVTNTEDLVDIADMPWEDGYKAMEELGS